MYTNQVPNPISGSQYFLQDSRGNVGDGLMFWAKTGGYTSDVGKAEAFDEDKAFAQNKSRPSDVPWPVAYITQRIHVGVDMQYVSKQGEADYPDQRANQFYAQDPNKRYVGNDILFLAKGGKALTANLMEADVLNKSMASAAGIAWLKPYIDGKSRGVVSARIVDHAEAFKGNPMAGALTSPPKEPRSPRYRCHGCGVFMKAIDYYCAPCPKCTTENRP